jgi:hypothetical protein
MKFATHLDKILKDRNIYDLLDTVYKYAKNGTHIKISKTMDLVKSVVPMKSNSGKSTVGYDVTWYVLENGKPIEDNVLQWTQTAINRRSTGDLYRRKDNI